MSAYSSRSKFYYGDDDEQEEEMVTKLRTW